MVDSGPPPGITERRSRRSRLRRRFARIPHPHVPHLTLRQVRVLRLFTLLFFFSCLVLYGVFRSSRFQELMRKNSERILSRRTGRDVSIGGFDLKLLPPAFVVRDVSIANDPRGLSGPCFSADGVELRGVPRVIGRRRDIPKIRLFNPRVVVEVFDDGSSNLDALLEAVKGKGKGGGVDVRLGEAVVQRGTFRFREWSARLDVLVTDTVLVARSPAFSRTTRVSLLCPKGRFRLEDYDVLDFRLGLDATLAPGRVHLDSLRLRSERLSVDASGGVENLKTSVLALAVTANTDGESLDKLFGIGLPLKGAVQTRGTVRLVPGQGFRIRGAFEIPDALFGPFPMTGSGVVRADPGGFLAQVTHGTYAGGTLEGTVRVARLRNPPLPIKITIKGRDFDFEQFLSDIDLKGTGFRSKA